MGWNGDEGTCSWVRVAARVEVLCGLLACGSGKREVLRVQVDRRSSVHHVSLNSVKAVQDTGAASLSAWRGRAGIGSTCTRMWGVVLQSVTQ